MRQLSCLDFGLFCVLKKRLIEKIIPRKIGLVKIKPPNIFNEVNLFHMN